MEDFNLPEDLGALAVEDIQELIEAARDEFHSLNDSESLEDETLDRMTELADAIDSLHDEFVSKVEFAISKRDEISSRVFGHSVVKVFPAESQADLYEEQKETGEEEAAETTEEAKQAKASAEAEAAKSKVPNKSPFMPPSKAYKAASAETDEFAKKIAEKSKKKPAFPGAAPPFEGETEEFSDTVTKGEADGDYPASDYAYVPDPQHPSEWKLRLTSSPGGDPDASIVGAAVAALGKGFRGNKVQIPAGDLPKVKAKVRAAWLKANSDRTEADLPPILTR